MRRTWPLTLQMALFQLGFGFVSILVLGILNRVMLVEVGMAAVLVGVLLALPSIVSPLRLWVGYLSDSRPIFGYRRLPYILAGMVLSAVGVMGGTLGVLAFPRTAVWGVVAAAACFLLYGMGKNAMATTSQALQADVFGEKERPKAAAFLRVTFVLGIVIGSVVLSKLVEPYSESRLLIVVGGTGLVAIVLSVLGNVGVEPTGKAVDEICGRVREVPFREMLRRTAQIRQVRLFFFFIGLTLLATLSQDLFLEPYGAKIFGMSVGETTRLNMFWGTGTLVALLVTGMLLVNRWGSKRVAAIGLWVVALSFVGLVVAGAIGQRGMFLGVVFVLGIGSGINGAGAVKLMLDFTAPENAGLLMGAWTIAHQLAEALGNALGGALVSGALALSGSDLIAFGSLFVLEVVFALGALVLLPRLSVEEFQATQPSMAGKGIAGTIEAVE